MDVKFSTNDFHKSYNLGLPQLIWTEIRADTETPVSAFLKLTRDPGLKKTGLKKTGQQIAPYSFLFESVEGGKVWGRFSIIALQPDLLWTHKNGQTHLIHAPLSPKEKMLPCPHAAEQGPLHSLNYLIEQCQIDIPPEFPSMAMGLFGYMGYEMAGYMESLPLNGKKVLDVPDSLFMRPQVVLVFDRLRESLLVVTSVYPIEEKHDRDSTRVLDQALTRLANSVERLSTPLSPPLPLSNESYSHVKNFRVENFRLGKLNSNIEPEEFFSKVQQVKGYIASGDIFQAVLSQRFETDFPLPSFDFYRSLRQVNPSPYLFFLELDNFSVAGSSPEVLVRVKDRNITIRPIAGTRRRGKNSEEDKKLADDLLTDKKELAEHLMLLDLGRNDVGRIAKIGSVRVTEKFEIEFYSHVMHIVSNVMGEIEPDKTVIDALSAGFPAGTVSGAPKIRAMEIIGELEQDQRGIYAGAVGYFDCKGNTDTCIALRTAIIKDQRLYIQAGAGIVADSDPVSEYQECENKARALVKAAEQALEQASRSRVN